VTDALAAFKEIKTMPTSTAQRASLEREFLGIRCRLIELAATLDRIDRAGKPADGDPRMTQIRRSLKILDGDASDRAEQVQMVFSLPYEKGLGD
jgi:hypothetical protein